MANNDFCAKKVKTQQQQSFSGPRVESGTSDTVVLCATSRILRQLDISIVVKLYNCFNVMHRNVYKENQILTCINNYAFYMALSHIYRNDEMQPTNNIFSRGFVCKILKGLH